MTTLTRRLADAVLLDVAVIVVHHTLVTLIRLAGHPPAVRALSANLPRFPRRCP